MTNISAHGVWIFLGDREVFLPFDLFPWLKNATIRAIAKVERPRPHHLFWPDLDVDVDLDSVEHPDHCPLMSGQVSVVAETVGRRKAGR